MKIPLPLLATISLLTCATPVRADAVVEKWVRRYSAPGLSEDRFRDLAVDGAGNVIVVGSTEPVRYQYDYYTAKYAASDGALLWEQRYNGPANSRDEAYGVALNAGGDVFVTGASGATGYYSDCYTIKYCGDDGLVLWGRQDGKWQRTDLGKFIKLDAAGKVIIAGRTDIAEDNDNNNVYYAAKYSGAAGTPFWIQGGYSYSLSSLNDEPTGMGIDAQGNVIVTGSTYGNHGDDYYTVKYSGSSGAVLWEKRHDSPLHFDDYPSAVAVDPAGNVAVTGESGYVFYENGHYVDRWDMYTAKYAASDGALLWEVRYSGPGSGTHIGTGVAMDPAGNVIVTGYSGNVAGNTDYYTAKYAAATGAVLWERRYDGPGTSYDYPTSVALDAAGNAGVTGAANGDYYTAKYAASDGAVLWEARYHDPANLFLQPLKLILTDDGGAVVGGRSSNGGDTDFVTLRYAPPAGDVDGDGLLDSWELASWGTMIGHSAMDDFDGDGLPELLEEAFGLNPKQPDALPSAVNEGGYLTITITKHPGVTYEVQTAVTPAAPAFSPATTTVLTDNVTTLKVRDNFLIGIPDARYLRVKVTAAP